MPDQTTALDTTTLFAFFNEVAILNQLATSMFGACLPQGFVVPQFAVLNHLVRVSDGRTPLDLARAFQVPKTSMTHSLAGLEQHGLIRLEPNPKDGRSKHVWITDAGRSFRDRAIAGLLPDMDAILARFPIEDLDRVLPVLARLRRLMDAMRDGD